MAFRTGVLRWPIPTNWNSSGNSARDRLARAAITAGGAGGGSACRLHRDRGAADAEPGGGVTGDPGMRAKVRRPRRQQRSGWRARRHQLPDPRLSLPPARPAERRVSRPGCGGAGGLRRLDSPFARARRRGARCRARQPAAGRPACSGSGPHRGLRRQVGSRRSRRSGSPCGANGAGAGAGRLCRLAAGARPLSAGRAAIRARGGEMARASDRGVPAEVRLERHLPGLASRPRRRWLRG